MKVPIGLEFSFNHYFLDNWLEITKMNVDWNLVIVGELTIAIVLFSILLYVLNKKH